MRQRSRRGLGFVLQSRLLRLLLQLLYGCCCLSLTWAQHVQLKGNLMIRGVDSVTEAALKQEIASHGGFRCAAGTGSVLPETALNDDYCDCPNGADEPGTAACAGIAPTSRKFYCRNEGFEGRAIPLSWVNDGHCDCCDGSDEWRSAARCENVCHLHRADRRRELELLLDRCRRGLARRAELVKEAAAIRRAQGNATLAALRRRLREAEQRVALLEHQKKRLDAWERWVGSRYAESVEAIPSMVPRTQTASKSNATDPEDILTEEVTRELAAIPSEQGQVMNGPLRSSWWRRIRKYLFRVPKAIAPVAQTDEPDRLDSSLCYGVMLSRPVIWILERAERLDQRLGPRFGRVAATLQRFAVLYASREGSVRSRHAQTCKRLAQEGWINARQQREAAARAFEEAQRLSDTYLGPDDVMLAVRNQPCLRKTAGQYEYEICLLQHVHQFERNVGGHGGVLLGSFAYVEYVPPNESDPLDRLVVHYLDGQMCWNGPNRRAVLTVECDADFDVVSVEETERCSYRIAMRGPVACSEESVSKLARRLEQLAIDEHGDAKASSSR